MALTADRYQRMEVIYRRDCSDDLWVIRARPEKPIVFKPGQYATLVVEAEGKAIERPYSICSSPLEAELEFFFELVPEGMLTPRLHKLQPGDTLWMRRQPKGLFTLNGAGSLTTHFLISTVTGVAPY